MNYLEVFNTFHDIINVSFIALISHFHYQYIEIHLIIVYCPYVLSPCVELCPTQKVMLNFSTCILFCIVSVF